VKKGTICLVFVLATVFGPVPIASAQTDAGDLISNLPTNWQDMLSGDLGDLLTGVDLADEQQEQVVSITLGKETINKARTRVSGLVNAARAGRPNFGSEEIVIPEPELDAVDELIISVGLSVIAAVTDFFQDWILSDVADDYDYTFVASFGSPGSAQGMLDDPTGLAVDPNDYLYLADT